MESNGLAMFPRPVYNRIPNFKGAPEAAAKLAELDVFKNANNVKVNPDKPQEPVRLVCKEFHFSDCHHEVTKCSVALGSGN